MSIPNIRSNWLTFYWQETGAWKKISEYLGKKESLRNLREFRRRASKGVKSLQRGFRKGSKGESMRENAGALNDPARKDGRIVL